MGIADHVLLGFQAVLYGSGAVHLLGIPVPLPILTVFLGLVTGIVVGSVPGLAGPMAMAVALPILISIFGYEASAFLPVLGFLIGIMKGATVGGAVPAILFNTPGTPDALMTTLDGYPMTRRGKAFKASVWRIFPRSGRQHLGHRAVHRRAVSGDHGRSLSRPAGKGGADPAVAVFHRGDCRQTGLKGLIAVGMGLFVAIGTGEDFYPRLTGGVLELSGGFPLPV